MTARPEGNGQREFDYIIVGGGSAGCILALRLTESPDVRVLLVEGGAGYSSLLLGVPLLGMRNMSAFLRVLWTVPQRHCNNRSIYLPVANVMGGGSSVNAMMYVRGDPQCYDRWAREGARGWDYAGVLPYFRRLEDNDCGETEHHGIGGPIGISGTRFKSRFGHAFIAACRELGLEENHDFTGARQDGAGFYQYSQTNGARASAATGQFRRAAARSNLTVWSRATVEKILLEGSRAVGISCRRGGQRISVRASREVVLAAGAVGSPKILMLSGIGPADELRALGISPVADVPGVGKGFQDHPRCPILYSQTDSISLTVPALAFPFLRWCLKRDGIFTSPTIAAGAFLRLSEQSAVNDTQYVVKWAGSPPHRAAVDLQSCLVDVESRGSVRLRSAEADDDPIIDPNYLSTQREVDVMVAALRVARSLARTRAMREFGIKGEIIPGPEAESHADLAEYVRSHIETCFHPAGSCRMGTDSLAVVDPELRVRGVDGLRVADASVMPSLISGNTNGPTMMIAEKAADIIRGRDALRMPIIGRSL